MNAYGLTDRQRQVLEEYISAGTTHEVAARLGISNQTVKNTLATVRRKTSAKNTLQAVYKIMKDI